MAKPLINFPLPQELKDEIYSYLLTPDAATEISRNHTEWRQLYRHFETAILCVNRSIGEDAARYFYNQNSFIRISHRPSNNSSDQSDFFGHLASLGARLYNIQTDNRLPYVAYSINVSSPPDEYFYSWPALTRHDEALILEQDIKKLWTVLRTASPYEPLECVQILSAGGEKLELLGAAQSGSPELGLMRSCFRDNQEWILKRNPASVAIHAVSSKYVELSASRKTNFYHNACSAVGIFFRMTFHDFRDNVLEHPRRTPATTIIWPQAFAWSRLDALLALKKEADDLVVAEKLSEALQMYRYAKLCEEDWETATDHPDPVRSANDDYEHFKFDVTFSIALLHFHLDGQPPGECCLEYDTWIRRPHASSSRLEHYIAIRHISWNIESRVSKSADLADALEQLRALPQNPRIAHDIGFIENVLSSQIPDNFEEAFKGKFSFAVFPFEIVDTVPAQGRYHNRQEGFVGWLDTKHLAEFTEEDKKTVNVFQKQRGLRITDWDLEKIQEGT